MEENKKQIISLSYIRAISCIAIILLHMTFSTLLVYQNSMDIHSIFFYRSLNNNLMWAVPCFLMVTGALLLNGKKEITYKKLFGKYILRILLAIVGFGAFYALFDMYLNQQWNLSFLLQGLYKIFTGNTWSHMWYLYCLVGLYLLLPAYRKIAKASSDQDLRYLLAVYVLFLSFVPLLEELGVECGFYIPVASIYPFYFFCGYAVKKGTADRRKLCLALLVLSTAGLIFFTWLQWEKGVQVPAGLTGYSSPLVILQSVTLFAVLVNGKFSGKTLAGKILKKIDEKSFGIYLVHMVLVRYLFRVAEINMLKHTFLLLVLLTVGVLAVSYVIVAILQKIPGIRKIV